MAVTLIELQEKKLGRVHLLERGCGEVQQQEAQGQEAQEQEAQGQQLANYVVALQVLEVPLLAKIVVSQQAQVQLRQEEGNEIDWEKMIDLDGR